MEVFPGTNDGYYTSAVGCLLLPVLTNNLLSGDIGKHSGGLIIHSYSKVILGGLFIISCFIIQEV